MITSNCSACNIGRRSSSALGYASLMEFRRLLPVARRVGARCLINDSFRGHPDFLLHEYGLPSPRPYFVKKTPIEVHKKECNTSGIFLICQEPGFLILPTDLCMISA